MSRFRSIHTMENRIVVMTEWRFRVINGKIYLYGKVFGHEKFGYGEEIKTSAIIAINKDKKIIITDSKSSYELKYPKEGYSFKKLYNIFVN
jgi:hypothetical protein